MQITNGRRESIEKNLEKLLLFLKFQSLKFKIIKKSHLFLISTQKQNNFSLLIYIFSMDSLRPFVTCILRP